MKLNTATQQKNADANFYQKEINNADSKKEIESVIDDINADVSALGVHRKNKLILNAQRKVRLIEAAK